MLKINVARSKYSQNAFDKLPFPASPRIKIDSAVDLQAIGVDEVHSRHSEIIKSNGIVRYPGSMEKFVGSAVDSLRSKKYGDTVTEPITLNALFNDDPIPELPQVEIIPIQSGMQRLKLRHNGKEIERIGCSPDATVYADGVEQSAVHALAHAFIDIVAQAHARREATASRDQLAVDMQTMRLSPSKIQLDERGELPQETRKRIETLDPFRRCYTAPQIRNIAELVAPSSSKSEGEISLPFSEHGTGTIDELYDQPVDTVSKAVDIKRRRLKEFQRGCAAEPNGKVSIPSTNKIAFHYKAEEADRTEPSQLNPEERDAWKAALAQAQEAFGNASWLQSTLFTNPLTVRDENDVHEVIGHIKTRSDENRKALQFAKSLLETPRPLRLSPKREFPLSSIDDDGELQRLMALQEKRPRQT